MQPIFIETTIQVERLLAEPAVQSMIEAVLHKNKTLTSSYVWMEYRRTIGQDYSYLINLFRQLAPVTVPQLLRHIGHGESLFSLRRFRRLLRITSKFLEQITTVNFDPFEVADLLEAESDWLINHHFFDGIDQMLDTTACDLVRPEYKISPGGRISCRRETARCALPALLKSKAPLLQQLSTTPTVLAALESKTRRALTEVSVDAELAKGEHNCWSLGDLILVLECPPDALLWTTNRRHFEPLCQLLGRQIFQPDSL